MCCECATAAIVLRLAVSVPIDVLEVTLEDRFVPRPRRFVMAEYPEWSVPYNIMLAAIESARSTLRRAETTSEAEIFRYYLDRCDLPLSSDGGSPSPHRRAVVHGGMLAARAKSGGVSVATCALQSGCLEVLRFVLANGGTLTEAECMRYAISLSAGQRAVLHEFAPPVLQVAA